MALINSSVRYRSKMSQFGEPDVHSRKFGHYEWYTCCGILGYLSVAEEAAVFRFKGLNRWDISVPRSVRVAADVTGARTFPFCCAYSHGSRRSHHYISLMRDFRVCKQDRKSHDLFKRRANSRTKHWKSHDWCSTRQSTLLRSTHRRAWVHRVCLG